MSGKTLLTSKRQAKLMANIIAGQAKATRYPEGVDPKFFYIIASTESRGEGDYAVSEAGAKGRFQFMEENIPRYFTEHGRDIHNTTDSAAAAMEYAADNLQKDIPPKWRNVLLYINHNAGKGRGNAFIKSGYDLDSLPTETVAALGHLVSKSYSVFGEDAGYVPPDFKSAVAQNARQRIKQKKVKTNGRVYGTALLEASLLDKPDAATKVDLEKAWASLAKSQNSPAPKASPLSTLAKAPTPEASPAVVSNMAALQGMTLPQQSAVDPLSQLPPKPTPQASPAPRQDTFALTNEAPPITGGAPVWTTLGQATPLTQTTVDPSADDGLTDDGDPATLALLAEQQRLRREWVAASQQNVAKGASKVGGAEQYRPSIYTLNPTLRQGVKAPVAPAFKHNAIAPPTMATAKTLIRPDLIDVPEYQGIRDIPAKPVAKPKLSADAFKSSSAVNPLTGGKGNASIAPYPEAIQPSVPAQIRREDLFSTFKAVDDLANISRILYAQSQPTR